MCVNMKRMKEGGGGGGEEQNADVNWHCFASTRPAQSIPDNLITCVEGVSDFISCVRVILF